jgi:hypothetical protein
MPLRTLTLWTSLALAFVFLILPGCAQDEASVLSPSATVDTSIGALHNEFLDLVHDLQSAASAKSAGDDVLVTAANIIAERYGHPSFEPAAVHAAVASAEYWYARHRNELPIYENPYVTQLDKSWRDRLRKWGRFAVAVSVDGVSGTITATGGGPVAGAVVGGLASYGADCLLFGCD